MPLPLDETLSPGQSGHVGFHETIADVLNDVDQSGGFTVPSYRSGTYAARPAAGFAGRVYYATDLALAFLDTGAAWQPLGTRLQTALAGASGDTTLTTANQALAGASVTITTVYPNAVYVVNAVFDFDNTVANGPDAVGVLLVAAAEQSRQAIFRGPTVNDRGTVAQNWRGVIVTPAATTFSLSARKNTSAGGIIARSHSSFVVKVFEGNVT